MIQAEKILLMTLRFIADIPFANPTPIIVPIDTCVVETGIPNREQISTVVAVPNPAVNPLVGVIVVILFPTVSITRYPQK